MSVFEQLKEAVSNDNVLELTKIANAHPELDLNATPAADNSFLLWALQDAPEVSPEMVSAILDLKTNVGADAAPRIDLTQLVLKQESKYPDHNALMLAIRLQPQVVPAILAAIRIAPQYIKAQLLKQFSPDGHNALMHVLHMYQIMHAKELNITILTRMLDLIRTLEIADQQLILSKYTQYQHNALMLAVRLNPRAIEPLLSVIHSLPLDIQFSIISQRGEEGRNSITLAARFQPAIFTNLLLEFITRFSPQQIVVLVSNYGIDGNNAVMLAATFQETVVPLLLSIVNALSDAQKYEILKQQENQGNRNALALAGSHRYNAVVPVLNVIKTLILEQQHDILKDAQSCGIDVLGLLAHFDPAYCNELFPEIMQQSRLPAGFTTRRA